MGWKTQTSVIAAIRNDDRLVDFLAVTLALDTLFGVTAAGVNLGSGHEFQGYQAWNRLLWVVLLASLLLRALRRIDRLSHTVSERDMRLFDVARTSREWLWETDENLVVTSCSPAIAVLLGRTQGEVIGQSLFEFVAHHSRAHAGAIFDATRSEGEGWQEVTMGWRHAGGHHVRLQGSAVPIVGVHGEVLGFRGAWGLTDESVTARRTATILRQTREILDSESVEVAFQPIVGLDTGTWVGVESLARFPDHRPPDIWIARAHRVGLGSELERLCLEGSLASLANLPDQVYMAVNASPQLIQCPDFAHLLESHADYIDRLVVELTEHLPVSCYKDVQTVLFPFRDQGLRLAVDDTGAGFASFNHVLSLRPDIIKLDRSLVTNLHADPARRAFVKAVASLAVELDATVTAEGVEYPEQLAVLPDLGVHCAQGYLFAHPNADIANWAGWAKKNWLDRPANALGPSLLRTRQWQVDSDRFALNKPQISQ